MLSADKKTGLIETGLIETGLGETQKEIYKAGLADKPDPLRYVNRTRFAL